MDGHAGGKGAFQISDHKQLVYLGMLLGIYTKARISE